MRLKRRYDGAHWGGAGDNNAQHTGGVLGEKALAVVSATAASTALILLVVVPLDTQAPAACGEVVELQIPVFFTSFFLQTPLVGGYSLESV